MSRLPARLAARLRCEAGYTIVELITVAAVLPVVLAGTLAAFTSFEGTVKRNQELNESQGRTREAIDQLARDLRNLASPTNENSKAVDKADPYDLVFQTVDPTGTGSGENQANVRRVRYCLDAPPGQPATLWSQTQQSWTTRTAPAMPSAAACPDPDPQWVATRNRALAPGVSNRLGAASRPLFQFNADPSTPSKITAIVMQAWVRSPSDKKEPREGLLRSQVFLRNQNEAPVCAFQATNQGSLRVLLNGSASYDPEGDDLLFAWADVTGGGEVALQPSTGIVISTQLAAGVRLIRLRCQDQAGLQGEATAQVTVNALPGP